MSKSNGSIADHRGAIRKISLLRAGRFAAREFPSLMVGDVACVIYCVRDVDDEVFDQSRTLRDTPRNIGVGAAACLDGSLETRGSVGNG
jgi:hypothetical protein